MINYDHKHHLHNRDKHHYWWFYPVVHFRMWKKRMRISRRSQNSPWFFYFLVVLGIFFIVSLWFFLHPNSPWHSRNRYIVAFEEIGNLKANNAVKVNGITNGYVEGFELTDSCVWTKIAVLSKVKIPTDSKITVANAGLMGERVVEITLGDANTYYKKGERIIGFFDMGSTNIGRITIDILKETGDIVEVVEGTIDTLFSEKKMDDYKKLWKKVNNMGNKTSRIVKSAEHSATASVDSLIDAKDKLVQIMDNIKPNFDGIVNNTDLLRENLTNLEKSLEQIKSSVTSIADKLTSGENTASLALDKNQNGALREEMSKISVDAEKLMEKIKKHGLDLNVDIF